ncbi:MAG TPA: hypothetical protein VFQ68_21605 [Streptosporangiaceae bacterium]|nr:hypothetical protein [Streptosporangiaceae bacterium]
MTCSTAGSGRGGSPGERVEMAVDAELGILPVVRAERLVEPQGVRGAISAVARSGSAGGVRIHSSNSGGPLSLASRSVTERVSHGIRSGRTWCSAPRTEGTGETACWP